MATRRRRRRKTLPETLPNPYLDVWRSLSPAQRLARSWRLRSRLKNLEAIHDAKTFPGL